MEKVEGREGGKEGGAADDALSFLFLLCSSRRSDIYT
jgi:hypothetical protein